MTLRDVIVTVPKARGGCMHLEQKIEATEGYGEAWWEFARLPKDLKEGSKLYIICEGYIRGSFTVIYIEQKPYFYMALLENWTPLERPIPFKVRGFQYMTKEILA